MKLVIEDRDKKLHTLTASQRKITGDNLIDASTMEEKIVKALLTSDPFTCEYARVAITAVSHDDGK